MRGQVLLACGVARVRLVVFLVGALATAGRNLFIDVVTFVLVPLGLGFIKLVRVLAVRYVVRAAALELKYEG